MEAIKLNFFTLNCWGIPYVSKNRKERIKAITKYLKDSNHNVVCLQEIWSEQDYFYIRDNLKTILPYSHYFYSGVFGSGLCVFSKWTIQGVFFHQWPLNGYFHKIHHGDWFGGKGVGLCRLKCKDLSINVYCTHLHAEYHDDDIYLAHRVLQAFSTAEFVNITSHAADISILAGDLNTAPGDLSFRLISNVTSLLDPYDLYCKDMKTAVESFGTSENINNSYSDPLLTKIAPNGKRIDHILYHIKSNMQAKILNFGNPLSDRVPGQSFSYSDHNAVSLEMLICDGKNNMINNEIAQTHDSYTALEEAMRVCEDAKVTIQKSKQLFLTISGLLFILLLGTFGVWPNTLTQDIIRIIIIGLCIYCTIMGTIWNKIEFNSIKASSTALENIINRFPVPQITDDS